MGWLAWTLEYAKVGVEYGARKLAEAAVAKAIGDTGASSPPPKAGERGDRASDDQYKNALTALAALGFTDIHLPKSAAYFSQGDKRWARYHFPKSDDPDPVHSTRTLQAGGCGPTSLAIAVATLRPDSNITPRDVAEFAVHNGFSGSVSSRGADVKSLVKEYAKANDLALDMIADKGSDAAKVDRLRDELAHGGVAVVHVGPGVFNYPKDHPEQQPKGGHWIAVNGYAVDKDGKEWFFVANPGKDASAQTVADKGVIVDRKNFEHHGAGMVRVSRETLEGLMKETYVLKDKS